MVSTNMKFALKKRTLEKDNPFPRIGMNSSSIVIWGFGEILFLKHTKKHQIHKT